MKLTLNKNTMNEVIRVYKNREFEGTLQNVADKYGNAASLTNTLTVAAHLSKREGLTVQQLAKMTKLSTQTVYRSVETLVNTNLARSTSKNRVQRFRLV